MLLCLCIAFPSHDATASSATLFRADTVLKSVHSEMAEMIGVPRFSLCASTEQPRMKRRRGACKLNMLQPLVLGTLVVQLHAWMMLNKNGDTALHIAAAMNKRKLARILVQAGVSTELRNNQGETAVNIATRKPCINTHTDF